MESLRGGIVLLQKELLIAYHDMRPASSLPPTLQELLKTADVVVSYAPMKDEQSPDAILEMVNPRSQIIRVSQDPSIDPIETARKFKDSHRKHGVAIVLIPGRAFDLTGTRHGRGRGWYDRFLNTLPREWWRIGITKQAQLHTSSLLRQAWDEPMDWVLVNDDRVWSAHCASSDRMRRMPRDTDHRTDQP